MRVYAVPMLTIIYTYIHINKKFYANIFIRDFSFIHCLSKP